MFWKTVIKVMRVLQLGRRQTPNFLSPMTASPYCSFEPGDSARSGRRITNKLVRRSSSSAPSSGGCVVPPPPPEPKPEDKRPDMEILAHTGQIWHKKDYRNVRFMNAKRYVNENFPMKLGHSQKAFKHKGRIVSCDGGCGILGHPKVFYNLDKPGFMHCFYCGRTFIKEQHDSKSHQQHDTNKAP